MMKLLRTWGLMIAFAIGFAFPCLHFLSAFIPYGVAIMLTITFMGLEGRQLRPQRRHLLILAANVLLGVVPWAVFKVLGYDQVAEAVFFAGICGEAASAPVIIAMLGGNVAFAATGLVLNSLFAAAVMSVLIPLCIRFSGEAPSMAHLFADVGSQVFMMLVFPCVLALVIRLIHPAAKALSARLKDFSLIVWLICMVAIAANGVHRVMAADAPWADVLSISGAVLLVCICGFSLGRLIGGKKLGVECSQCLGQKNTTVTIYLALHYAAPMVFLGPAIYLFFHHIYNTYQMVQHGRRTGGC